MGWAALSCAAYCEPGPATAVALIVGGAGAGLGALIDAVHKGSEVVYLQPYREPSRRLSLAPLLTRDAKGLLVRIQF